MKVRAVSAIVAAAVAAGAQAAQIPFLNNAASATGESAPTLLSHPSFPAHSLRIHRLDPELCERSGARSWTGYLDVNLDKLREGSDQGEGDGPHLGKHPKGVTEHMFFWAFESRSDPKTDPVVLWMNGGPGCSSSVGAMMELGACNVKKGAKTEWNPWAWNNNATVVFLDQPVGVGYSYADWTHPEKHDDKEGKHGAPSRIYDTPSAARDTSAFLHLLALHHEGPPMSSFHIAGESYGGRYIPLLAQQVLEDNKEALAHPERGIQPLPLASVMIGNGFVSPKHQYPAYVDYACKNTHGWGQFLSDAECKEASNSIPTCLALVDKCNQAGPHDASYDVLACRLAGDYCEEKLGGPYERTGRSPYDFSHYGEYKEDAWVQDFLNTPRVRKALGADAHLGDAHNGTMTGCSDVVYKNFAKSGDPSRDSVWAVQELLARNVRVLTYTGVKDWICNYQGVQKWTEEMGWPGREAFVAQPKVNWYAPSGVPGVQGDLAGRYRSQGNFTYAEVDGAGHFVPHDQPKAALALVNYWLHGKGKEGRLEA